MRLRWTPWKSAKRGQHIADAHKIVVQLFPSGNFTRIAELVGGLGGLMIVSLIILAFTLNSAVEAAWYWYLIFVAVALLVFSILALTGLLPEPTTTNQKTWRRGVVGILALYALGAIGIIALGPKVAPRGLSQAAPSIGARIDSAILGREPNGSDAALVVTLINHGAQANIDPGSWRLTAIAPNGARYIGEPNTIYKTLDFCFPPSTIRRFVPQDALYTKGAAGLKAVTQGVLWFTFPGLQKAVLVDPGTVLNLSAEGTSGQNIRISVAISELLARTGQTEFFTGLQHPAPMRMPCKENMPY